MIIVTGFWLVGLGEKKQRGSRHNNKSTQNNIKLFKFICLLLLGIERNLKNRDQFKTDTTLGLNGLIENNQTIACKKIERRTETKLVR